MFKGGIVEWASTDLKIRPYAMAHFAPVRFTIQSPTTASTPSLIVSSVLGPITNRAGLARLKQIVQAGQFLECEIRIAAGLESHVDRSRLASSDRPGGPSRRLIASTGHFTFWSTGVSSN